MWLDASKWNETKTKTEQWIRCMSPSKELTRSITANWYRGKAGGWDAFRSFLKTFRTVCYKRSAGEKGKRDGGKCLFCSTTLFVSWRTGFLLWHVGFSNWGARLLSGACSSAVTVRKLSNWHLGLAVLRHVGSKFLDQGSKMCSPH